MGPPTMGGPFSFMSAEHPTDDPGREKGHREIRSNKQIDGKMKMSHSDYRSAIASIAADETDGEDVTARIAQLARMSRMSADAIRHEVTEAQEG